MVNGNCGLSDSCHRAEFLVFDGSFYSFVRRMRLLFVLQYNATWFRFLVFKKKISFLSRSVVLFHG